MAQHDSDRDSYTADATPDPSLRERVSGQDLRWSETRARRAYLAASAGHQRAARRTLALALVALLLVTSLGAIILTPRYFAAQRVAAAYCDALRGRDYAAAYALLADTARGGLTLTTYTAAMSALDTAEGLVTGCAASALAGYQYTPGAVTASDTLQLARQRASSAGMVALASSGGTWRITAIAPSLTLAPLEAVAVVAGYCAALRASDYTASYALLSVTEQGLQSESDYTSAQLLRDTLTGRVTACAVISLTRPDAQTLDALLSVTRATGPRQGGEAQLQSSGSVWRITQLDPAINGVDVGPYRVGQRFCAAVSAGDFGDAYGLLTSALQTQTTPDQMRAALTAPAGQRWRCERPASGSYEVAGSSASYRVSLSATHPPAQETLSLSFTLIAGVWRISAY